MSLSFSAGRVRALCIVGFSALCGSVSLIYPFGRDQGTYGYAGWVLLDGGALYRDIFVIKPPMTAVVHASAMALLGVNTWAIRVFDVGWTAATALVIAAIAFELWNRKDMAAGAGLAFPFLYYQLDYWNVAQTDGWMVLPAAVAIWSLLRGGRVSAQGLRCAFGYWLLAGAMVGVAVLFKYTAASIGLPALVAVASMAAAQGRRAWLSPAAAMLGGTVVLGASALWLTVVDAWQPFVEIQRNLVVPYVERRADGGTASEMLSHLLRFRGPRVDLLPLALAGPIAIFPALVAARRLGKSAGWGLAIAVAWWISAAINVVGQGKFFEYHYVPLAAPSALLVGLAFGWLRPIVTDKLRHPLGRALALVSFAVALSAATPIGSRFIDLVRVATGAQSSSDYIRSRREYSFPTYDVEEVRRAAATAREMTTDGERVFVWAFEPTINVRAKRRTVGRFAVNGPFRPHWRKAEWEDELLESLRERPPELFIVGSGDRFLGLERTYQDSASLLRSFGALNDFLETHYIITKKVGRYAVWRLVR